MYEYIYHHSFQNIQRDLINRWVHLYPMFQGGAVFYLRVVTMVSPTDGHMYEPPDTEGGERMLTGD